jgi:hypothetical protein
MKGVLGLFHKKVSDRGRDNASIMVRWAKDVYKLQLTDALDTLKMNEILRMGFSRIPVMDNRQAGGREEVGWHP